MGNAPNNLSIIMGSMQKGVHVVRVKKLLHGIAHDAILAFL